MKEKFGQKEILTKIQESELCSRLFRLAAVGYPLSPKYSIGMLITVMKIGFCIVFSKSSAGCYWLKGFLKRNAGVKQRKAQRLNPDRAQKVNTFIVEDHVEKLRDYLSLAICWTYLKKVSI